MPVHSKFEMLELETTGTDWKRCQMRGAWVCPRRVWWLCLQAVDFCKVCGHNVHVDCQRRWASAGKNDTCPFLGNNCRSKLSFILETGGWAQASVLFPYKYHVHIYMPHAHSYSIKLMHTHAHIQIDYIFYMPSASTLLHGCFFFGAGSIELRMCRSPWGVLIARAGQVVEKLHVFPWWFSVCSGCVVVQTFQTVMKSDVIQQYLKCELVFLVIVRAVGLRVYSL